MHEQPSSQSKSSIGSPVKQKTPISTDDRLRMVAEAAYFRALHRAFQGGDINDDWYRAEKEIDAVIAKMKAHR